MTIVSAEERPAPQSAASSKLAVIDAVLLWGTFCLVIFAVLAFGATEEWAIFVLEAGASLLFLIWAVRQIVAGRVELTNPLFLPMALFAVILLAQLLLRMSFEPYATHTEVWKYAAYGMLFIVADNSFRERDAQVQFLTGLSLFGFLLALFAIAQNSAGNEKIYWLRTTQWKSFFGPYVNRNHYAGLMEMLAPIPLAFCFQREMDFWRKIMFALFSIVMGTTIFLCGSRSGMIAFNVELVFFAILLSGSVGWRRTLPGIVVFSLLVAGCLIWLDQGNALSRIGTLQHPFEQGEVTASGVRIAVLRDGLRMFRQHPFLGWGLGAFPDLYPQFRSFYTDFFINEAHNDYLQVLVETGIAGFAAIVWFLVLLYRGGFRRLYGVNHNLNLRTLGVLTGCTGLLFHSATDFNLHIPANAALFYVFCSLITQRPSR